MKYTISFVALSALVLLSSCITTVKTARTAETSSSIKNATVADLKVTDHRITYTMTPSKEIQRAGLNNVKQAALQEALTKNGNADVMVEPEFVISMKNNFIFGKEVTSITVTGRPAYYQNFRTLNDSVWATPGFYGQPKMVAASGNKSFMAPAKRGGVLGAIGAKLGLGKSDKSEMKVQDESGFRRTGTTFYVNFVGGKETTTVKYHGNKDTSKGKGYLGVLGTIGVQTSPQLFLGIGSGWIYGWDNKTQLVPIFGDARYFFSPAKSAFFVDFKIGGSMEVHNSAIKGGVMVAPSIGYSFGSFELAFQYIYQKYKSKYNSDLDVYSPHMGLSMGFKF